MTRFNLGRVIVNLFNSEGRNIALIDGIKIETRGDGTVAITRNGHTHTYSLPDGCLGRSIHADPSRIIIDGYLFKDGVFKKMEDGENTENNSLAGQDAIHLADLTCPVCDSSYTQIPLPVNDSLDLYCHRCNHWFEAEIINVDQEHVVQTTLLLDEEDEEDDFYGNEPW